MKNFNKKEILEGRTIFDWLFPIKYTQEDDISYLQEVVLKNDTRFREYKNSGELYEYLYRKTEKYRSPLNLSKLADTADRIGAFSMWIFPSGEESVEIPLKAFLYWWQKKSLEKEGVDVYEWKKKT
ncbi:MAG: hypothetical protein QMD85_04255, partial [Candidatus Aenigmarchaeota archaeon]|nr:hypothetical protein [Candidatus Aenigmarchaeota archaeon]MDI6722782.1 hypothetical protein [Candidatus Aenigmarchaeota archaeon]